MESLFGCLALAVGAGVVDLLPWRQRTLIRGPRAL